MSLKDMCTLDLIPDLTEAGVDSFKIEGRMKKPEYVAAVTAVYRKYTDLYLEKGREKFQIDPKDPRRCSLTSITEGAFRRDTISSITEKACSAWTDQITQVFRQL